MDEVFERSSWGVMDVLLSIEALWLAAAVFASLVFGFKYGRRMARDVRGVIEPLTLLVYVIVIVILIVLLFALLDRI